MLTEKDIADIKQKWEVGVSINRIIRSMPFSAIKARQLLNDMRTDGMLPPRERKNGTELVVAAYQSGVRNPYEIAEMLGYAHNTVVCYLNKTGVKRCRNATNWNKRKPTECSQQTKEIQRLLADGTKACEVAKMFGISKQRVSQIKKRSESNE